MALTPNVVYRRLYEGANHRLRSFAGGRFAHRCRPTSIMFLLTELCNARCVHCDIWKNKGKEDSPSASQWLQVVDDLRSWLGPVSIVFTGGEALLKPYSTELAAHASSRGFWLEFLTHGYWKDQKRIEQLALARPSRITISTDGVGAVHSKIRGREDFFEHTNRTIETLVRMRSEDSSLRYRILLKTVVMEQNLADLGEVARYATREGMAVFYQPIEQNYNTAEDPTWFLNSPTWPRDPAAAVRAVQELIRLKRTGLHIDNTEEHLETMVRYFLDPAGLQRLTQAHMAQQKRPLCAALTMLQLQSNGDVRVCAHRPPVGNIKEAPVRQIWERRTRYWEQGCCFTDGATVGSSQPAADGFPVTPPQAEPPISQRRS
jgi:MoaA/NifB/PqqE/SkfB family radical SAM enzyme